MGWVAEWAGWLSGLGWWMGSGRGREGGGEWDRQRRSNASVRLSSEKVAYVSPIYKFEVFSHRKSRWSPTVPGKANIAWIDKRVCGISST